MCYLFTLQVLDADKSIDELYAAIRLIAMEVIQNVEGADIGQLWTNDDQDSEVKNIVPG